MNVTKQKFTHIEDKLVVTTRKREQGEAIKG